MDLHYTVNNKLKVVISFKYLSPNTYFYRINIKEKKCLLFDTKIRNSEKDPV